MDATEKEAAARDQLNAMFDGWRKATARFSTGPETLVSLIPLEQEALDAYAASVASRVRAELAAKVRWLPRWVYTEDAMEAVEYGNWLKRDEVLALLEPAP